MGEIGEAAASGDRRAALEAMRDKLARDMDDAPAAVVAQIAGRLQAVLADLEALPPAKQRSQLDELAKRRKERVATAKARKPAERSAEQRR